MAGKDTDLTYAEMEKVAGDLIKDMHGLSDFLKKAKEAY